MAAMPGILLISYSYNSKLDGLIQPNSMDYVELEIIVLLPAIHWSVNKLEL